MSEPAENPFGDPAKLTSRAFPEAMDGTIAPNLQAVGKTDPSSLSQDIEVHVTEELIEHYAQVKAVTPL